MRSKTRVYRNSALLMMIIIFVSPLGFVALEGMSYFDSLYMTIITISTVGFKEVRELDAAGRAYVMLLILVGVGSLTYIVHQVGALLIEGEIKTALGRRMMDTKLRKLSDHTIIAGYGRVGREVAHQFRSARKTEDFVVIESDPEAIEDLIAENILYVRGDVTMDETLRLAGVESARTLVSTVPGDSDNVYLALTARHLNPDINIIARADHAEAERKLMRAGANQVVSPHQLGGIRMAHLAIRPSLVHFFHSLAANEEGYGIEETRISESSPLAGRTLRELDLRARRNITVIGIRKPNSAFILNPDVDTRIETGDVLLLIGESENLLAFSEEC